MHNKNPFFFPLFLKTRKIWASIFLQYAKFAKHRLVKLRLAFKLHRIGTGRGRHPENPESFAESGKFLGIDLGLSVEGLSEESAIAPIAAAAAIAGVMV